MKEKAPLVAKLVALFAAILLLSFLVARLWGGAEEKGASPAIEVSPEMTVVAFGEANRLPRETLKTLFGASSPGDLARPVGSFGVSLEEIRRKAEGARALAEEHAARNWVKIPVKFALWAAFLGFVFFLMRKKAVTFARRRALYLGAVTLFGVALGADPSPMGTVKDAVVLLGRKGVVFPPRMVALSIFLLLGLLANKFVCSWGCQVGTLQDLLFRLNRRDDKTSGPFPQARLPFVFTNSVRVTTFAALTLAAFLWGVDLVGAVDPFRLYNPKALGWAGGIFLGALLAASLVVYRPWCHLFCPFGLLSWLGEKASVFRIKVEYGTCIACGACERSCPSPVMGAILRRDRKAIPDCFACGTCIAVCPTGSVSFAAGRKARPPEGKYPPR
jgi:ferredoxin